MPKQRLEQKDLYGDDYEQGCADAKDEAEPYYYNIDNLLRVLDGRSVHKKALAHHGLLEYFEPIKDNDPGNPIYKLKSDYVGWVGDEQVEQATKLLADFDRGIHSEVQAKAQKSLEADKKADTAAKAHCSPQSIGPSQG